MQGIERAYCDACIRALLVANQNLMDESVASAVSKAAKYGKGDTFALDAIPEIAIEACIAGFDGKAILITEELGGSIAHRMTSGGEPPPLFFCDPTDRSGLFRDFLQKKIGADPLRCVGEIVAEGGTISEWERDYGAPATITGATSAITFVREGLPTFSVILNYITQELLLVCGGGIKLFALPHYQTADYERLDTDRVLRLGKEIGFRLLHGRSTKHQDRMNFFTFLGKPGYPENFRDCGIFSDIGPQRQPIYDKPGGPSRTLYLSDLYTAHPVGFILANGEKIVEWTHWLTVMRCAKFDGESALQLFEVTHDRPWTKEGISMAPSPAYSIFRVSPDGLARIDIRPFCTMARPSQFRATLVLAVADNVWLLQVMKRCQFRQIIFG